MAIIHWVKQGRNTHTYRYWVRYEKLITETERKRLVNEKLIGTMLYVCVCVCVMYTRRVAG